jgi:hypothetical protein
MSSSGAVSGSNYIITFSGAPDNSSIGTGHITITATNACGATTSTSNTGADPNFNWTVVAAGGACATPSVGTVSPNSFTDGTAYTGTITVANATSASITSGLPSGITASGAVSGLNYVFTLTGTPTTAAQTYDIRVDASNATGGCTTSTVTNQPAGTGTVAAGSNFAKWAIDYGTQYVSELDMTRLPGPSYSQMTFAQDGSWAGEGYFSNPFAIVVDVLFSFWVGSAPVTNIGAGYWIRFTQTATGCGGGTWSIPAGWTSLSSPVILSVSKNTVGCGLDSRTFTIELASDAAGTTIVSTTTGVIMTAGFS